MDKKYNLFQAYNLGDLITQTFKTFLVSAHFWKTLLTTVLPLIVVYAYFGVEFQMQISQLKLDFNSPQELVHFAKTIYQNPIAITTMVLSIVSNFWISLIVYSYVILYSNNEDFTIQDILTYAFTHFLKALSSQILLIILLFSGFILFLAPGIYLMVPLQFYILICLVEEQSLLDGVNRSIALNRGFWFENLGLLIIAYVFTSFLGTIISFPSTFITHNSAVGIVYSYFSISIQAILQFFLPFIFALQYYNLLVRRNEIEINS